MFDKTGGVSAIRLIIGNMMRVSSIAEIQAGLRNFAAPLAGLPVTDWLILEDTSLLQTGSEQAEVMLVKACGNPCQRQCQSQAGLTEAASVQSHNEPAAITSMEEVRACIRQLLLGCIPQFVPSLAPLQLLQGLLMPRVR